MNELHILRYFSVLYDKLYLRNNYDYTVQCDFKVCLYIYVPLHVSVSK
jgi:hypothetical protein